MEGISYARQKFGAEYGGAVVIGVAIIILKGCEGLLQSDAGNKSYADPVMDKSAGDVGAVSRGAGCRMANNGLLALEEVVSAVALGVRQGVEPQKSFSGDEFVIVASFSGPDIVIEGFRAFGRWSFR